MSDEPRAGNVVEALARVARDLPGIGKDQTASAQQGGYAYRGIEQITIHAQPLFARHGIVFTPHVKAWEVRDITVNNKPWTDVYELVEYTVYGPGGIEDRITIGPILAIGRDNSDKGANKCLTQAFKYALLQALTISDSKDDADGQTHAADDTTSLPSASKKQRKELSDLLAKVSDEQFAAFTKWVADEGLPGEERLNIEQAEQVLAYLTAKVEGEDTGARDEVGAPSDTPDVLPLENAGAA